MRWAAPRHAQSEPQSRQSDGWSQSGRKTGTQRDEREWRKEEEISRQMWESQTTFIWYQTSRWPAKLVTQQAGDSSIVMIIVVRLSQQTAAAPVKNKTPHYLSFVCAKQLMFLSLIIFTWLWISEVWGLFSSTSHSRGNCCQESKDTWWVALQCGRHSG